MRYVFLVLALLLLPGRANAYSGLELLRGCSMAIEPTKASTPTDVIAMGMCIGFLNGVMDTAAVVKAMKGPAAALFCAPEKGVENEQVARVVVKYLNDNPKYLHEPARMSAIIALAHAFPCR